MGAMTLLAPVRPNPLNIDGVSFETDASSCHAATPATQLPEVDGISTSSSMLNSPSIFSE